MRRSTNTVRLLDPEKPKKRGALGRTASSAPKTLKLAVRLLETINGPVRGLTHYRGDLSEIVTDAVRSTDLNTVGLVDIAEAKVAETCVMISEDVYRTLKEGEQGAVRFPQRIGEHRTRSLAGSEESRRAPWRSLWITLRSSGSRADVDG
jgi:hypothetical protein